MLTLLASGATAQETKPTSEASDVSALAERTQKSVVVIKQYGRNGKQDGMGAGFAVSADGLIATCLHVIGEARPVVVELADGRRFEATEVMRRIENSTLRLCVSRRPISPPCVWAIQKR
jgi:S1-C subfamily serine protease